MVGRDGELGRLLALLDDAEAGQSVAALVSGDAGVGKSRLVSEVTRLAEERGFAVLSGQCAELGDSVPYLPLADALRGATQSGAAQSTGVRDALSSRPALGRLLPEGGYGQLADGDRTGLARQQMFGEVLGLLAELAAAAPVLLVLEDLHWADASTRDLVTFLSRMLHRERVALIGTYRTDDLHRRHPLRPVVAELLRLPGVIAVDLAPLAPFGAGRAPERGAGRAGGGPWPHRRHRAERHRDPGRGQRLLRRGTADRVGERRPVRAQLAARRAGGPAAQPGGTAVRDGAAGAPGGRGGRAQGRRRAGPGRVRPGRRRVRGRGPGGGHPATAGARRRRRLRLPARPAA